MPTAIHNKFLIGTIYALSVRMQAETSLSQQSVRFPGKVDDQDTTRVSDSNHFTQICISSLTADCISWLKPRLVQAFKKRRT